MFGSEDKIMIDYTKSSIRIIYDEVEKKFKALFKNDPCVSAYGDTRILALVNLELKVGL
jgi:hypothetical protein